MVRSDQSAGNDQRNLRGQDRVGRPETVQTALASLNGRLYLAWRGDGNDQLNISVFDGGHHFINKWVGGDTSTSAPALCANAGSLFLSWKGDGNENINVAQVTIQMPTDRLRD